MAGYILIWFNRPQAVTHPSINRVRRRATTLIKTINVLPLSRALHESDWLVLFYSQRIPGRSDSAFFPTA